MDVVGSVGYFGQQICFIDAERFGYLTGRSVCVYDTVKGPREMIWRLETGILQFSVNNETQQMAIASARAGSNLEVLNVTDFSLAITLNNQTSSALVHTCFSRLNGKIFAITDIADHRILMWNISGPDVVINHKLDGVYHTCVVNPCDSNMVCLFGAEGLTVGNVSDVLEKSFVTFTHVTLENSSEYVDHEINVSTISNVNFALWLPNNHLLVANSVGHIFDINAENKKATRAGIFNIIGGTLIPLCAVLSSGSVVVGTNNGEVYWFPILNQHTVSLIVDFSSPQQVANLTDCPILCLTVDANHQFLLAGTQRGEIFKLPLQINNDESSFEEGRAGRVDGNGEGGNSADYDGAVDAVGLQQLDTVDGIALGSDIKHGMILCTSYLSIGVQKFSGRSKSSLTMLVTGSHCGAINFWRQSAQVIEPLVVGGGVRRSAPRALKSMFTIFAGGSGQDAVSSLEFLSLPNKNACLCCVGLESGVVELWSLEGFENEDEEARDDAVHTDDGGSVFRLVEDDEGACIVRVE